MMQLAPCAQLIFAPLWIFAPTFKKIIDIIIVHWIVRTLRNDPRCRHMVPKFHDFSWGGILRPPPSGGSRFWRSDTHSLRYPNYCANIDPWFNPILPSTSHCPESRINCDLNVRKPEFRALDNPSWCLSTTHGVFCYDHFLLRKWQSWNIGT